MIGATLLLTAVLGLAGSPTIGPPPTTASPGRWMTHKVERGETVAAIATRWGVSAEELQQWNPWLARSTGGIRPGKLLQLRANKRPPLRMRAIYFTGADDTWASVAARVGSTVSVIQAGPNRALAEQPLRAGLSLIVLRDADAPGWNPYAARTAAPVQLPDVDLGGLSEGRPNGGRLVNGIQLPQSELYDLWKPELCYGSTHAVRTVMRAIQGFRSSTGWTGQLTIGSMSREGGGPFAPHKSHRSGRDVDIRLPRLDGDGSHPRHDEVDWHATWALIASFIATEHTEVIFLSRRLHPLLQRAAEDMGEGQQAQAAIGRVVVHSKGHHAHIHVRIDCGIDETDCQGVVSGANRRFDRRRPR